MWHSQIDKITQKIASGIGAIEQIRSFAQPRTLRYIYYALVQLHFSYCSAVWKIAVKSYQPEISYKKKKKRAAPLLLVPVMMLMLSSYYNNCVGNSSASNLRSINDGLQIKPINNLVPHYLSSMFTERNESGYAIGISNKFEVPLPRTSYLEKGLSYRNLTL